MKFTDMVYGKVKSIPRGRVSTYAEVARATGNPKAVRAVGNILHKNPTPIIVPCHRVVRSDGRLASCGHAACTGKRRRLLEKEGIWIENNRIDMEKYSYRFQSPMLRSISPAHPSAPRAPARTPRTGKSN